MMPSLVTLDAKTYDDLTESRRINDLLVKRIITLEERDNANSARIDNLETNQEILFKLLAKLKCSKEPNDPKILDDLHKEMIAIGRKQVDFATAARMVKRSKSRMLQLKGMIGQDMRFMLVPSETHSQKVLIRLRA
jgi:hypothetical protein